MRKALEQAGRVEPDMVINEEEGEQFNPFNTLVIGTREGAPSNRVRQSASQRQAYMIPANTAHSFRSNYERAGFVIIMWGEGA